MRPLAAILCSASLARRLGARPVAVVTDGITHPGCLAFLRARAAEAVSAAGEIPIIARDAGPIYAWPLQPGARDTGAGM